MSLGIGDLCKEREHVPEAVALSKLRLQGNDIEDVRQVVTIELERIAKLLNPDS